MIWINVGERSYQATAVNIAKERDEEDKSALWIERPSGNSVKLLVGSSDEMMEHKNAIDFAVEKGYRTYEVK